MQKKNCTLVAWTENGQVRMILSLVQAGAVYYLEKARRLEEGYSEVYNAGDEISWLLRWSGALEDCAVYYLRFGLYRDAYKCYDAAARVCSYCSDELWLQGCRCDFPTLPLLYRFLAMHGRCRQLVRKYPALQLDYRGSELESDYLWFTTDDRDSEAEVCGCIEYLKARDFGKS